MRNRTQSTYDVLVRGADLTGQMEKAIRQSSSYAPKCFHLSTDWNKLRSPNRDLFIVSHLDHLVREEEFAQIRKLSNPNKRYLLFPHELPVESIAEYLIRLNVRDNSRLYLTRPAQSGIFPLLQRFVEALCSVDPQGSILDAWREGLLIKVKSGLFETLSVPIAAIPQLASAPLAEIDRFKIDPQGDFIHWPDHDIHMGWAQFEQLVRPQARLRAMQKSAKFNLRYGVAIKTMRESLGIAQNAIAGLDARTVRRIERGETRATTNAIEKLAQAHELATNQYLARVAELISRP